MKKAQWTVGTARTLSVLHLLIAPLIFGVSNFEFGVFLGLPKFGIVLGIFLGLLLVFIAWGLWNRRAWARKLAMVFHGVIAIAAFSGCVVCLQGYLRPGNTVHAPIYIGFAICGGIAFGVFILSSGFLWWFWRGREPENT